TLLARGPGQVAEVAVRCGFTTVQYMHAVFKRELGCTPREFQQRSRPPPAPGPAP
ncbi:MAG: AraC family transcriptional regulator, partial [Janthinobacterium sp.]